MVEKEKKPLPKNKKQPFTQAHKGFVMWICLIFFVSAWMFLLGIFVGRGTAPVRFDIKKLQKELAALKEAVLKKEKSRFQIDSGTLYKTPNLGFYKALKDSGPDAGAYDSLGPEISKEKDNRLPKKITKSITPQQEKIAAPDKKAKPYKKFTVQIAALRDSKLAGEMVEQFKKKGHIAYMSVGKIPENGIWYRVRIGAFRNRDEAGGTLSRLKEEGFKGIIVER